MQAHIKCKACVFPFKKCAYHASTSTSLPPEKSLKKKDNNDISNNNSNNNRHHFKKKLNTSEAYHTLDESMGANKTHSFSIIPFHSPTKCPVCNELIIGIGTQGFKCQMCKYGPVHKKCICNVPHRQCTDQSPNGPVSTASFQLKEEVINLKRRIQELETKEGEQEHGNNGSSGSETCVVCYQNKINCVLLECGHRALCMNCGKKLIDCPICRRPIERIIRVYDAH